MPPSTARIITSQTRTGNSHWKRKTCEVLNLVRMVDCSCCGKGKADNAWAIRYHDEAILGEFHSKNEVGEDVWSYYILSLF